MKNDNIQIQKPPSDLPGLLIIGAEVTGTHALLLDAPYLSISFVTEHLSEPHKTKASMLGLKRSVIQVSVSCSFQFPFSLPRLPVFPRESEKKS